MSHLVTLSAADFKEEDIVKIRERENQVEYCTVQNVICHRYIHHLPLLAKSVSCIILDLRSAFSSTTQKSLNQCHMILLVTVSRCEEPHCILMNHTI